MSKDGGHGRDERDTRRRAIFRNSSQWHVDVQIPVFKSFGRNIELFIPGTQIADRQHGRLLHHISKLHGDMQLSGTAGYTRFDKENISAVRSPEIGRASCRERREERAE